MSLIPSKESIEFGKMWHAQNEEILRLKKRIQELELLLSGRIANSKLTIQRKTR